MLEKRTCNAFYETSLSLLLRSLGVDTVIFTGLHTNICVRHMVTIIILIFATVLSAIPVINFVGGVRVLLVLY
ncbi:cysteine hydrolase [Vulcanisaeta souniana]|uniref:Isochorismatase-like domain-containing protein n=1 Tax=Vulcanisaeta souniana JCM 11219 TaxID=1293586 RepID=A0A830ECX4_9CREN|nr:cysteine hydrolase [Vulcanisaeta souniana]BDR91786.1 hypothetical protein Vsou_08790 [Vulcanisaeta souniana JCM 11219]GGI70389.1 hypothetical protein GCM10007112_04200 [Vulcanisaeta souniana JCM 11219]